MHFRSGELVAAVALAHVAGSCSDGTDAGIPQELIILHTNDLHSAVEGFSPVSEYSPGTTGNDGTLGGFARLATLIKNERTAAGATPVLLLDAGDWFQGSLFGWLLTSKSVELSLMQQMGYDAMVIGNHDFEFTAAGLATGIAAAQKNASFAVPVLAPANMTLDSNDPGDSALLQLQAAGALKKKLIKDVGALKIGIFGLMGKSAAQDVKLHSSDPVKFGDPAAAAQAMVTELRETDKVGLVICLSHGGSTAAGTGEDVELARAVPGLDVIVSGHTHDATPQPLVVGKTIIAQAGYWARNLGKMQLKVQGRSVTLTQGKLIPVDDSVNGDTAIQTAVTGYRADIDALLKAIGSPLTYATPIARTAFDLVFLTTPAPATSGDLMRCEEAAFGDLIADAYLNATKVVQPTEPPDVAIEANGFIGIPALKGSKGVLWFADLVHSINPGIGPDHVPGYPLVTFFLSGAELKAAMELLGASQGVLGTKDFFLQIAGMNVEYLAAGAPYNSVLSIKIGGVDVRLDDTTKCYKVVSNIAAGSAFALFKQVTGGRLVMQPKESDCKTPIADMTTRIVDRDPLTAGLQELKTWQAVVSYLSSFTDTNGDGIPDVPAIYSTPQRRIVAK